MMIQKIPKEVLGSILSSWIAVTDVARLDTAMVNHELRHMFLQSLQMGHLRCPLRLGDDGFFQWLDKRKARMHAIRCKRNISGDTLALLNSRELNHIDLSECEDLMPECIVALCITNQEHLTHLSLKSCHVHTKDISEIVQHCGHLRHVNLAGCRIEDAGVLAIVSCCPNLEDINLARSKLTNKAISSLKQCKNLTALNISHCAQLTDECLGDIASMGCKLQKLGIRGYMRFTETALCALIEKMTRIETVLVGKNFQITDNFVVALSRCAPGLKEVDLTELPNLTDMSVIALARCPELRRISLRECSEIKHGSLAELAAGCPKLRTFDMNNSFVDVGDMGISILARSCPDLHSICLGGCAQMTDVSIEAFAISCKYLREVNISQCVNVTDAGLMQIANGCKLLQKILMESCLLSDRGLLKLADCCKYLDWVDVRLVRGVSDVGIKALLARCPELRVLNISHNHSISDKSLCFAAELAIDRPLKLRCINVAGCSKISSIGVSLLKARIKCIDINGFSNEAFDEMANNLETEDCFN